MSDLPVGPVSWVFFSHSILTHCTRDQRFSAPIKGSPLRGLSAPGSCEASVFRTCFWGPESSRCSPAKSRDRKKTHPSKKPKGSTKLRKEKAPKTHSDSRLEATTIWLEAIATSTFSLQKPSSLDWTRWGQCSVFLARLRRTKRRTEISKHGMSRQTCGSQIPLYSLPSGWQGSLS